MTNIAYGSDVGMSMYGAMIWILRNKIYDLVICKF